jgi:hypothetical protein
VLDGTYVPQVLGRAKLMNGQLDQRTALLLLAGGGTTYVALLHPAFGVALLVGVGVVTLLHILLR